MAKTALERFRDELTTYPDIVLLHCLDEEELGSADGAVHGRAQQCEGERQIKAVGCSCHNFKAMQTAAASSVGRCDPGPDQYAGRRSK